MKIDRLQKLLTSLLTIAAVFSSASFESAAADKPNEAKKDYAIVIHGGTLGSTLDQKRNQQKTVVLKKALNLGTKMLDEGRTGLDTVEAVIRFLEDSPEFNAGKGAVFNSAGGHELDASIMDGRTRAAGAVGGVSTVKNPISLARLVMTETRHVLLVTDGAEKFADGFDESRGILRVPNKHFSTDHQRASWKKTQAAEKKANGGNAAKTISPKGTVGCVALDRDGNIAAGTSTGGLTNKKYGRIGDSPIISAGTYADNRTCGVSCTGTGEDFIRHAVSYDISARMRLLNQPLEKAVHAVLHDPEQLVRGGVIAVSRTGEITMQFNRPGMSRAAGDSTGYREVKVGK
jgi:beta-aspartyl-peptidase (threonine type)